MNFQATVTNEQGCCFDSTEFTAKNEQAAIVAAKQWAAGRGGRYILNVSAADEIAGHIWTTALSNWVYQGSTRRSARLYNLAHPFDSKCNAASRLWSVGR